MTERGEAVDQHSTPTDRWLEGLDDDVVKFQYLADGRKVIEIKAEFLAKVNLLGSVSQVVQVSPHFTPFPKIIRVDIEKGTYKQSSEKVGVKWVERRALHARELAKIGAELGVNQIDTHWDDMGGRGTRATVYGQMRGPDGTWRTSSKSTTVNFEHRARKLRNDMMAKWEKYNKGPWERKQAGEGLDGDERKNAKPPPTDADLQLFVDNDLDYLPEKVQSKAWARVLRDLLGVAPNYTRQELERPFFAILYAFTPDTRDPAAKQIIELQFQEGMRKLYGAPTSQAGGAVPVAAPPPRAALISPDEVVDDAEDELEDDADPDEGARAAEEAFTEPMATPSAEEEWPEEPKPPRPQIDPVLGGKYQGKKASEVIQTEEGRRWIATAVLKLRNPATRVALLGWLSYAYEMDVGEVEADRLAKGEILN